MLTKLSAWEKIRDRDQDGAASIRMAPPRMEAFATDVNSNAERNRTKVGFADDAFFSIARAVFPKRRAHSGRTAKLFAGACRAALDLSKQGVALTRGERVYEVRPCGGKVLIMSAIKAAAMSRCKAKKKGKARKRPREGGTVARCATPRSG